MRYAGWRVASDFDRGEPKRSVPREEAREDLLAQEDSGSAQAQPIAEEKQMNASAIPALLDIPEDPVPHGRAIRSLCKATGAEPAEVADLFGSEFSRLEMDAEDENT